MFLALLTGMLMFCLPLTVTLVIRSFFGAAADQCYLRHPLLPLALSFVPALVLKSRKFLMAAFGKIGFCLILELSMTALMFWFSPNFEPLFARQGLIVPPLLLAASAAGFFTKKLLLPQTLRFYFFATVGIGAIIDLTASLAGAATPGFILSLGISLLFVFLQFAHARILQERLKQEAFADRDLRTLIMNYGLIFSINLAGMMLTTHPMKMLLAFMFDDIAAKNAADIRRR